MKASYLLWRSLAAAREGLLGPAPVRPGLRILCYHSVGADIPGDPYGLSIPPAAFRRQMELLAGGRFGRPVSLGGARLDGREPEVCVTFDDGFRDILTTAAPILEELGIPFTLCATAVFVRDGRPPYLSLDDLRALAAVPRAEIGAHGANHLKLAECGDETLGRELSVSRDVLEQALGRAVAVMTWPHGSASRRARDAAAAAGFTRAGCSLYGLNAPGRDPLLLKRTEIVAFDDEESFVQKVSGGWDWYALRQTDPKLA